MLSIQVIQAVLKDARMREQAHVIQGEVMRLMEDVGRLDERVRKLQSHFAQANEDVRQIITSTEQVTKRGERIGALELGAIAGGAAGTAESPATASSATGSLRLRVVDGED